jgi:hypothetical protein
MLLTDSNTKAVAISTHDFLPLATLLSRKAKKAAKSCRIIDIISSINNNISAKILNVVWSA